MSTPTPTIPSGWTLSEDDATATAPDGSTATGDVFAYVSQATQQIASDASNIATLQGEVASLQAQIAQLENSNPSAAITALQSDVATLKGTVSAIQAELASDENEISTEVIELKTHEQADATTIATIAAALGKLAQDIAPTPATVPAEASTVADAGQA